MIIAIPTTEKKWTELEVQVALFNILQGKKLVLPNFTPWKWWECDIFSLSNAGYYAEYEIKLSVSDFKADAKKCDRVRRVKHENMRNPAMCGPNNFYYVMPKEISDLVEIPEWAGLVTVISGENYFTKKPYTSARITKLAPRLHNKKCDSRIIEQAEKCIYWRMWSALKRLSKKIKISPLTIYFFRI